MCRLILNCLETTKIVTVAIDIITADIVKRSGAIEREMSNQVPSPHILEYLLKPQGAR